MTRFVNYLFAVLLFALAFTLIAVDTATAQSGSYRQTNLVSDLAGSANSQRADLVNPWGIAFQPGQPFWVVENGAGSVGTFDATGAHQINVAIPTPPGDMSPATPTGIAYNPTTSFVIGGPMGTPSQFLFATEDGTISGWGTANGYVPTAATTAIDHSTAGAVYKGLAIVSPACCATYLAVANFHDNLIETFTGNFNLLSLGMNTFVDPNLPAGYAPFNIQQVGTQLFVTYALQDTLKHDPIDGAGNGIVDIYALDGTFVRRFVSNGPLNAPWGVTQASAQFGPFSNDILIGNFGDGVINAFDPASGNFLGALKDANGAAISNSGLWALVFRNDGAADPNTLFFTAGLANEQHGLFGSISFSASANTPDFSLSASTSSTTVIAGQSGTLTLTATPVAGFSGNVNFSCSAPTGITCSFNPASVPTSSGAASTTLTIAASSTVSRYSAMHGSVFPLFLVTALGILGGAITGKRNGPKQRFSLLGVAAGFLLLGTLLVSVGCGGYSSGGTKPNRGVASVLVMAQSGTVSHTTTISVTVQ